MKSHTYKEEREKERAGNEAGMKQGNKLKQQLAGKVPKSMPFPIQDEATVRIPLPAPQPLTD